MEGQKPEVKSDEIDLGHVFSRMGDGVHAMWMGFMRFLATVRRTPLENRVLFILIITASIIVGVVYSSTVKKNFYESKMIFSSDYLNKRLAENIIEDLDILTREKSKKGLATTLGLPDSAAAKIIGFDIEPFMPESDVIELEILKEQLRVAAKAAKEDVIDKIIERIEIENRHAYEITVRTLSPSVVSKLQEAIVGHFQRNPYISKRVDINERNLIDLKTKLESDISKMDSLKMAIYKHLASDNKGSTNVILSDKTVTDPIQIFNESIEIYEIYEKVSRDAFTKRDFEVIDGFTPFGEPANASTTTIVLESILIGIFLAYAAVALKNFNTYLANLK